jgi:hypothetical protein
MGREEEPKTHPRKTRVGHAADLKIGQYTSKRDARKRKPRK